MCQEPTFPSRVTQCVRRIAQQGEEAVAGLVDLTSDRLVRFATAITRNQHDAEDAVQAALVKFATDPQILRETEQPWAYLLRMVRNESLLVARRKRRCRLLADLTDLLTRRRVDEIEREETRRAVWTALRRLPTRQSEVVVLKIWEQMTFAEIAEVLQISPGTAASRYRYGMGKLSELLRGEFSEVPHV